MIATVRLCVVLALTVPVLAQPQLVSADPTAGSMGGLPGGEISLTFDTPLDPSTVTSTSVQLYGRWSGVHGGPLTLTQGNTTIQAVPVPPFACGEQVTVTVQRTVASASGIPLATPLVHSFATANRPAAFTFTLAGTRSVRLPGEPNIITYGGHAGDLNRDGFADLAMTNEASSDLRVFMNDGAGGFLPFTIHPLAGGSVPSPIEGGDLNGDGWMDLVIANTGNGSIGVFMNDGAGGLLPSINYPTGGNQPRGLGLLDANGDGNLDALVANRSSGILSLLLGNGNGTFQAASTFQGNVSNETALAVGDANGDGIADFFVGGYSSSDVALFLGDGVGGFYQSATRSLGGQPWMIVAGDVDGDGNLDVAAATANGGDAVVVRGDGAGGLLPAATYPAGSFSIAIDLGDVDGDGDLDMIASNYGSADFTVYRNLGNGTFASPITLSAPQAGSCMLVVDLNGDEKLELVGVDEQADVLLFFDVGEPLVQLGFPSAALDVNGVGGAPGFLGQPNVPVTVGSVATLGIGGHPGGQYAVALGVAQPLGLPTSGGTFNLALAPTPIPVLDGFNGLCPCTIPPTGQAMIPLQVPAFLPVGFTATLQGAVANPANLVTGWSVTNPVRVVFN